MWRYLNFLAAAKVEKKNDCCTSLTNGVYILLRKFGFKVLKKCKLKTRIFVAGIGIASIEAQQQRRKYSTCVVCRLDHQTRVEPNAQIYKQVDLQI